jgi:prepilin-type N-terminal cleavage/methylation domain-containing protein
MQRRRLAQAGFTLAELMAVVVIVGVLAAVGVTYFRRHALASKVTEAQAMVQSIRAAEERYKAENRQYLDVSKTLDNYYPTAPNGQSRQFFLPSTDTGPTNQKWWLLNPTTSGYVQFGYAVVAGPPGSTMPQSAMTGATARTVNDHWYEIQAVANNDGDSVYCVVVGTSLNGEVAVENEGE